MLIQFYKYHGTGNDFILIDDRDKHLTELNKDHIKTLCTRRFGIGADGLMLLKSHPAYDFEMDYYNADGSGGTMCGNGGRCISAFAKHLGIIESEAKFIASDGPHQAFIDVQGLVKLKMIDVTVVEEHNDFSFLHTGSPHYVQFVDDVQKVDVFHAGQKIRYSEAYHKEGTNVNFISVAKGGIAVRTYERGVENETFSCGTGSVAAAIAYYLKYQSNKTIIPVKTLGGSLEISFENNENKFTNVFLKGPAEFVYKGEIEF